MCGITGIISKSVPLQVEWIKNMTDALRHRGPDDEGFLAIQSHTKSVTLLDGDESSIRKTHINTFQEETDVFLGHRRLSILDLSSDGHQPMATGDGRFWIVYNGEIYNYLELRDELKNLGYHFKTNTDTEVLLVAYQQWGDACLNRLNGMWAFVIYDREENILFGARDPSGVKPFYYFDDNGFFAFASEIKALLTLSFVPRKINPAAAFDYLVLGWEEQEEEGLFKGIFELQPSCSFTFDLLNKNFTKKRYCQLTYRAEWESFSEISAQKHIAQIRELLIRAIKLRLRSDVPIGTCLSGGMDSSAIVCIINNLLRSETIEQVGSHQRAFTACYTNSPVDESSWAKLIVDATGAEWKQTFPSSEELLSDIEELVRVQDVPFASSSIYAQYRVMQVAKENGVKVLLDGQGADELFTGYPVYYGSYFLEMLKHFRFGSLVRELSNLNNAPIGMRELIFSMMRILGAGFLPQQAREKLYRGDGNIPLNPAFWNEHKERIAATQGKSITTLNEFLFKMRQMSLKTLLRYEDRNSMHFSIESRTPFADDIPLLESVFAVPSSYKIHNGWSKYLLRESMEGFVPDAIRYRTDKVGFATPQKEWLVKHGNEMKQYFSQDLEEYLDTKYITEEKIVGAAFSWRFINFAIWKKVNGL